MWKWHTSCQYNGPRERNFLPLISSVFDLKDHSQEMCKMKRLNYLIYLFTLLLALSFGAPVIAQDLDYDTWDTDDLIEDDYGYYDEDFDYELDDDDWDDWDDWYADADDDWFGYDDPGEDGWFDW